LTATVKAAVPLPVPLPVVNVMNDALLVAVQLQLVPALTVIGAEPVPPSGPNVVVGCTTLNEHVGAVVVVVESFFEHAAANSEATSARITVREGRWSKVIRTLSLSFRFNKSLSRQR
jgi:hypothetical protein